MADNNPKLEQNRALNIPNEPTISPTRNENLAVSALPHTQVRPITVQTPVGDAIRLTVNSAPKHLISNPDYEPIVTLRSERSFNRSLKKWVSIKLLSSLNSIFSQVFLEIEKALQSLIGKKIVRRDKPAAEIAQEQTAKTHQSQEFRTKMVKKKKKKKSLFRSKIEENEEKEESPIKTPVLEEPPIETEQEVEIESVDELVDRLIREAKKSDPVS